VQRPNPRQDFGYQLFPDGPFFLDRLIYFSQQARGLFFLKTQVFKDVYAGGCL
jgi:hypothetical protein